MIEVESKQIMRLVRQSVTNLTFICLHPLQSYQDCAFCLLIQIARRPSVPRGDSPPLTGEDAASRQDAPDSLGKETVPRDDAYA